MKQLLILAAIAFGCAAPAVAQPDPHMPDLLAGYCPGGKLGIPYTSGYCDGVPYPDGSYWHMVRVTVPFSGTDIFVNCVVNARPVPAAAPPGGCDGAA